MAGSCQLGVSAACFAADYPTARTRIVAGAQYTEAASILQWMLVMGLLLPFMRQFGNTMHPSTIAGINRLMQLPMVQEKNKRLRVPNMTELTPLAYEMPYEREKMFLYGIIWG